MVKYIEKYELDAWMVGNWEGRMLSKAKGHW